MERIVTTDQTVNITKLYMIEIIIDIERSNVLLNVHEYKVLEVFTSRQPYSVK